MDCIKKICSYFFLMALLATVKWQQKRATCFATLLQNELKCSIVHLTRHPHNDIKLSDRKASWLCIPNS